VKREAEIILVASRLPHHASRTQKKPGAMA